jgi:hypothetical protein
MSTKVTMAFVAAIIALAFPTLVAGNDNRENQHPYRSAQYCIPQLDDLPGTTRLYCSR